MKAYTVITKIAVSLLLASLILLNQNIDVAVAGSGTVTGSTYNTSSVTRLTYFQDDFKVESLLIGTNIITANVTTNVYSDLSSYRFYLESDYLIDPTSRLSSQIKLRIPIVSFSISSGVDRYNVVLIGRLDTTAVVSSIVGEGSKYTVGQTIGLLRGKYSLISERK